MSMDDNVHQSNDEASQLLVEHRELLPMGRALDVAMGGGRNSIYLAEMGCEVEGIDISEDAIMKALQLAKESGVDVDAKVMDLEKNCSIKKEAYDLIICFNYLYRPLIPCMKEGLRIGGTLVYETFTVDQVKFGRPKNPDYLLKSYELLEMFQGFRCLVYHEGVVENRKAVASFIGVKI